MSRPPVYLTALLVVSAAAVAAPVPKSLKRSPPNFNGKWMLVRQNNGDREVPQISPWIWEINGEELVLQWPNGDGTFRKNQHASALVRPPDGQADEVNYVYDPKNGGRPSLGRATVEDGEFVIAWTDGGRPRPAEIKPGPGVNYYRFKRMPDK